MTAGVVVGATFGRFVSTRDPNRLIYEKVYACLLLILLVYPNLCAISCRPAEGGNPAEANDAG